MNQKGKTLCIMHARRRTFTCNREILLYEIGSLTQLSLFLVFVTHDACYYEWTRPASNSFQATCKMILSSVRLLKNWTHRDASHFYCIYDIYHALFSCQLATLESTTPEDLVVVTLPYLVCHCPSIMLLSLKLYIYHASLDCTNPMDRNNAWFASPCYWLVPCLCEEYSKAAPHKIRLVYISSLPDSSTYFSPLLYSLYRTSKTSFHTVISHGTACLRLKCKELQFYLCKWMEGRFVVIAGTWKQKIRKPHASIENDRSFELRMVIRCSLTMKW